MIVKIIQTYGCCGSEWKEEIIPKNEGVYYDPNPYCVNCLRLMRFKKVEAIDEDGKSRGWKATRF